MCRRKHSAAWAELFTSPCGLHIPCGEALAYGAAIRDLQEVWWGVLEEKEISLCPFTSCVRGFLTKWLLFPLNDNLLLRILEIKIKFWKRETWYSGGRQILQQHKVMADSSGTSRLEDWCGAAQSGQTSELPAVVESWILLILFLSFKVTDSGTHGVYPP